MNESMPSSAQPPQAARKLRIWLAVSGGRGGTLAEFIRTKYTQISDWGPQRITHQWSRRGRPLHLSAVRRRGLLGKTVREATRVMRGSGAAQRPHRVRGAPLAAVARTSQTITWALRRQAESRRMGSAQAGHAGAAVRTPE